MRIQNEWNRAGAGYAERVSHLEGLTGGGLNAPYFLKGQGPNATVFDDAAADTLTGGGGSDWFFARRARRVLDDVDSGGGETVTET